jgi:hypothetical protein
MLIAREHKYSKDESTDYLLFEAFAFAKTASACLSIGASIMMRLSPSVNPTAPLCSRTDCSYASLIFVDLSMSVRRDG